MIKGKDRKVTNTVSLIKIIIRKVNNVVSFYLAKLKVSFGTPKDFLTADLWNHF